jgi:hypothetical protein
MKCERLSIRDISMEWNAALRRGDPLTLWRLGDLLDDFRLRATTREEKWALVSEDPVWVDAPSQKECNAYWAAMVETLCREAGMNPPAWTELPCCYLHRPWFAGAMESLKAILLAESPIAFRRRNLFVSSNALVRA